MSQTSDILEEYINRIQDNVRQAILMQNLAKESAKIDNQGNWSFTISQEDDTVSEVVTLTVSEKNVSVFAPEEAVKQKVLELARKAILENDINFKKSKNLSLNILRV